MEYIDRYKLGPLFRFLDNHQVLDEYGKLIGYKNLRTINKTLKDILIRRTKKEIIDQLPGRIDKNFFVEMTTEQESEHWDYYNVVARLANRWIEQGYLSEEDRQNLLISLNCMRMVSDSTYILNRKTNSGNKINELKSIIQEITEGQNNKIVIFSQWKRMFDLLTRELNKMGLKYEYLNGDVPADQRNTIIEKFQSDQALKLFLSTDAGGVGVNLQSANILINIDLPWNPAVLEQRIGRIYRLGQKKHIQVYNFISKFSIEHRILHLLDFKKAVFKGVLDDGGEDRVMLEGFLQSLKAMLDVNLEDPDQKESVEVVDEVTHSLVAESDALYQRDHQQDQLDRSQDQGKERDSVSRDEQHENVEQGILSGFRNKIKRLINRFSNFLARGKQK